MLQNFFSHANWLAIAVAALVYFALGALWYSALFRKAWMEGHNIPNPSPEDMAKMKKNMPLMMIKTLVMGFVFALGIAVLVFALQSVRCVPGIKLGVLVGGMSCIPMVMSHMYLQKPLKVTIIDAAYHLVGVILMSIIISIWH